MKAIPTRERRGFKENQPSIDHPMQACIHPIMGLFPARGINQWNKLSSAGGRGEWNQGRCRGACRWLPMYLLQNKWWLDFLLRFWGQKRHLRTWHTSIGKEIQGSVCWCLKHFCRQLLYSNQNHWRTLIQKLTWSSLRRILALWLLLNPQTPPPLTSLSRQKIHFIGTFTLFQSFRSQPDNSALDQSSTLNKNPDSWWQVLGLNTSRVRTSLLEKSESL